MKKYHVEFDGLFYDSTRPESRAKLGQAVVYKAYNLWLDSLQLLAQVRAAIRATYQLVDSVQLRGGEAGYVCPSHGLRSGA